MTERVYLHVGSPKSGTSYLQQVLRANRDSLADAGVLVAGEGQRELVHAAMVVREDPRLDSLPARAREAWQRQVDAIRGWTGSVAVLSYELLAGATEEQAARALADLAGLEVHVVVTSRDLAQALPSAWQERLKFALTTPLEGWEPPPATAVRSEWGWRTMDPAGVIERWAGSLPEGRAHLVTVPREGSPEELWRRFAGACGLTDVAVALPDERVNTSLGVSAAELLRRVNGHLDGRFEANAEHARWLRDTLAHEVLAPLDDEPIGTPDHQLEAARTRYRDVVERLRATACQVHGDLADLEPTASAGRTPGDVTDAEVADVAALAIVELLARLRDSARTPAPAADPALRLPATRVEAGKNLVRALMSRSVHDENERLHRRLDQLERELAESRLLQGELAAVTDIVTELLLPRDGQNDAALVEALRAYRRESL